jgi:hypothetical protein
MICGGDRGRRVGWRWRQQLLSTSQVDALWEIEDHIPARRELQDSFYEAHVQTFKVQTELRQNVLFTWPP